MKLGETIVPGKVGRWRLRLGTPENGVPCHPVKTEVVSTLPSRNECFDLKTSCVVLVLKLSVRNPLPLHKRFKEIEGTYISQPINDICLHQPWVSNLYTSLIFIKGKGDSIPCRFTFLLFPVTITRNVPSHVEPVDVVQHLLYHGVTNFLPHRVRLEKRGYGRPHTSRRSTRNYETSLCFSRIRLLFTPEITGFGYQSWCFGSEHTVELRSTSLSWVTGRHK